MPSFKNYNGENVEFPLHTHDVTDTTRNGSIALATPTEDGFMSKDDYKDFISIDQDLLEIDEKIKTAVFIKKNKSSNLIKGSELNSLLTTLNSNLTSIIFTKTPIPSNMINRSTLISTPDSEVASYIYSGLDGNTVYISPAEESTTIYANSDSTILFSNLSTVTHINLINFDTSKVTAMDSMFYNCGDLTYIIGIENLNTINVTSMYNMFSSCRNLKPLNLSNFNTVNVINMRNMFSGCEYLTSIIGIENFNTSKVFRMDNMFDGCMSLISLDLSKWDTSKLSSCQYMFSDCFKLNGSITIRCKSIDAAFFIYMFNQCSRDSADKFKVNYIDDITKEIAKSMVESRNSGSVLGDLVQ